MKAGLVTRTDIPDALSIARRVVEHLSSRGVDLVVETDTALALDVPEMNTDLGELEADFVVTVGGDGTILRTAMGMKEPGTPLLGVNLGRRGFLTETTPEDINDALDMVIRGEYRIEECFKLSSRCLEMEGTFPDSLNEVLIASSLPSKMLLMGLRVDGEHIINIQADGAMVATPTGSTAYNLSAGGSILAPGVEAMMLTTICPYSYFRSIAVPLDSVIEIELLKPRTDGLAIIDGRVQTAVKPFSTIEVRVSPYKARFIRFRSFYGRLSRRLTYTGTG